MSRAAEPAIHAPGYELAHCLPPAGLGRPADLDIYRFNRVVPMYTPDPCIAPSDGQLICPPDCGKEKRNDVMCPSGIQNPPSDSFQFYDTRRDAPEPKLICACPKFAQSAPCTSLGPITDLQMCPCINRPPALKLEPGAQVQAKSFPQPVLKIAGGAVFQPVGQFVGGGSGCLEGGCVGGCVGVSSRGTCRGCGVFGGGVGSGGGGGYGRYDYYVNNSPIDRDTVRKIPLCEAMYPLQSTPPERHGARAPTPYKMMRGHDGGRRRQRVEGEIRMRGGEGEGGMGMQQKTLVNIGGPGNCASYHCQNPYYSSDYLCRPVFDRKYLDDCPEQNGPHPDHYTFL